MIDPPGEDWKFLDVYMERSRDYQVAARAAMERDDIVSIITMLLSSEMLLRFALEKVAEKVNQERVVNATRERLLDVFRDEFGIDWEES